MKLRFLYLALVSAAAMAQSFSIVGPADGVVIGTTFPFTASQTAARESIVWSIVSGPGTIDSGNGLYTAPDTLPAALSVTVKAVAPGVSANSTFNLRQPPISIASWSPKTALPAGPFSLTVTGMNFTVKTIFAIGSLPVVTKYISSTNMTVSGTIPANAAAQMQITAINPGPGGSTFTSPTLITVGAVQKPGVTVSPASVTMARDRQVTFTAQLVNLTGQVNWSASAGTITAGGLYTPPATGSSATITATSARILWVAGTATVTFTKVPPTTITGLTPAQLPMGPFELTIDGSNFSSGMTVSLGGRPLATTFVSAVRLTCRGVTLASEQGTTGTVSIANLAAAPVAIGVRNPLVSAPAAMRFLQQAAFGPRPADVMDVQQLGFQEWLKREFSAPPGTLYRTPSGAVVDDLAARFMTNAVMGNNQLRQRVAFALSQFFVVTRGKLSHTDWMAPYQEMLYSNAFGTYPALLRKVTLDPAMGNFLDMVNNDKANPALGSVPNENYAREILQLFSIGTRQLNPDGSVMLVNGVSVPTYDQSTVQNFAKVFTGWTYAFTWASEATHNPAPNYLSPMVAFDVNHDMTAKTLLNGASLPAGQSAEEDMNGAIANIVAHPNVAPFFCKFLIQHLVTSNPSASYVSNVVKIFNNNGRGLKGDLQAVITAILLDPEARAGDDGTAPTATFGHLQEPVLWMTGIFRALNGQVTDMNSYFPWDLSVMNQDIFNAPSVFNYYTPQFQTGGNLAPEFQIESPWAAVYRANAIALLFAAQSGSLVTYGPGASIDLSAWVNLGADPSLLVEALDSTFMQGHMPAEMKSDIVTTVAGLSGGNLRRLQAAIYLTVTSSLYQVMH